MVQGLEECGAGCREGGAVDPLHLPGYRVEPVSGEPVRQSPGDTEVGDADPLAVGVQQP